MKHVKLYLGLIVSLLAFSAQAQFTVSGEFRPRTEYNHGYKSLTTDNQELSLYTAQRTRLNLGFADENLTTFLSLQDVRIWGNQPQLVTNQDFATSIHQAWAELKLAENLAVKLGRQEVIYDDHRIFGNVGWAHQARSHDMALVKYSGIFNAHLGLAYNQDGALQSNLYSTPSYKAMQFLWINNSSDSYNSSILFLNNGMPYMDNAEQKIAYSQTIGLYLDYNLSALKLHFNTYYQTGKDNNNVDLNAYELSVGASLKIDDNMNVTASYEMLSGNDQSTASAENNAFTPFYGTNHKFNGWMDYFYVGNHGGSVGLQDINLKLTYKVDQLTLTLFPHIFMTGATLINPADNTEADAYLGTEIDLSVAYKFAPNAAVSFGYSQMLGTESMQILKGGDYKANTNWAWLMFAFTPEFLKTGE